MAGMGCARSAGCEPEGKKGDAGWLRGQTTRRRIHRRSDGGPERRQVLRRGTRAPLCMLHRNPPLCVKTGITRSRCAQGISLSARGFLAACWLLIAASKGARILITASKGSGIRHGVGRPAGALAGTLLPRDTPDRQAGFVSAKSSGAGGLAAAVGEDDSEIGDDDR